MGNNLVAKHNFNRASTHPDRTKYTKYTRYDAKNLTDEELQDYLQDTTFEEHDSDQRRNVHRAYNERSE